MTPNEEWGKRACARVAGPDPTTREVVLPYSEACMHMRVAGKLMLVAPVGRTMAQLYELDGRPFSFPITRGEAGLSYEEVDRADSQ